MTKKIRKILILILLVLFFLITPLVVLYSQGYRFDLEKRKFVLTGAFFFKVEPKNAEVWISDKLKKETSILFGSILIENLLPKSYQVQIKKPGYHPWKKNLEIKEKLVTEAKNIVLVPENLKFSTFLENIKDFRFSANGKEIIYKKNNEKEWILKISNPRQTKRFSPMEERPGKAPEMIEDLLTYQIFDGNLLGLDQDGFLFQSDFSGKKLEIFNLKPLEIKPEKKYEIVMTNFSKILIKEDRTLYYLNPESRVFEKISDSVKNLKFSPDLKKIVYFNDHEIWVFFLESQLGQPQKKAKEKVFLTRFSEKIGEVFWLTSHYLIFNVGEKIKVTEIDDRDQINIVELASFKDPKIFFNQNDKKLYVLSGGKLYVSEKLLP